MELPVNLILNGIAGLVFFFFWLASFVILYHLTRFGIGVLPKRFSVIFLIGTVTLFSTALILYISLDITQLII